MIWCVQRCVSNTGIEIESIIVFDVVSSTQHAFSYYCELGLMCVYPVNLTIDNVLIESMSLFNCVY